MLASVARTRELIATALAARLAPVSAPLPRRIRAARRLACAGRGAVRAGDCGAGRANDTRINDTRIGDISPSAGRARRAGP
ncbi:MAG: hypothetical protein COZ47_00905 [Lysobacterales bacterium CG_4_10_14_3_um_filter_64_11]|nr:MAG: hypothetical protein COZ47_00905 [Xanthomonadales bacterium CG_4_10_14_3_um_filter_64_11]